MEKYILDQNGDPVPEPDLMKWAEWFERTDRHLAEDNLANGVQVSTVFLGVDHAWVHENSQPVLWETMIFGGEHDQYQRRYTSKKDAAEGHAHAIRLALGLETL
jgi:hypothetical protein